MHPTRAADTRPGQGNEMALAAWRAMQGAESMAGEGSHDLTMCWSDIEVNLYCLHGELTSVS